MAAIIALLLLGLISGTKTTYVSYNSSTISKSIYLDNKPDEATDGDDYSVLDYGSCFHSSKSVEEYIKIDLSTEYSIASVTIINRVETGSDVYTRFKNAEVRIGMNVGQMRNEEKCGNSVTETQVLTSPIIDVICQQPISGRYVMIWFPSKSEYINICEVKVYSEIGETTYNLNPVNVWMLSLTCLLADFYDTSKCAVENTQPIDLTLMLDSIPNTTQSLTIAFYIYPFQNSMGNIIGFGNDDIRLRMEQTYSNGVLYQSEVTVFYGDQQLTRAHVLLPEVWTFLAVTFDGINKNIKIWRNGEIASIGETEFTHLPVTSVKKDIKIGGNDAHLQARVALLQLYDRALNESEMKAASYVNPCYGYFEKLNIIDQIIGNRINSGIARSPTHCSSMCHTTRYCDLFSFDRDRKQCVLYSTNSAPLEILPIERGKDYFREVFLNNVFTI